MPDEEFDNNPSTADELIKEEKDENIKYKKLDSNATCLVEDIEGFVYGASSSRFWMMRKHINSIDIKPGME